MANTSDIRKGLCIKFNNDIYKIVEFLHVKPGKGPAFVRTKLKSVSSGKVIDNTFSAGHKIDSIRVETNRYQFLYKDGETYHFNTDICSPPGATHIIEELGMHKKNGSKGKLLISYNIKYPEKLNEESKMILKQIQ